MSTKKKNKNMENIKKGLKGLAQEALKKGEKAAYTAAAGVEQYASLSGLGKLVKGAVQKGKEAREYVREQGGLAQMAEDAGERAEKFMERTMDAAEGFIERVNAKYKSFEDEFFTDGNLNQERVNAALGNAADSTRKYGIKAVNKLKELAAKGAEATAVRYRDIVPDEGERASTYAGIGSKIPFYILTRTEGDKCLSFHEEMRKGIQGRPKYKGQLLADIKGYVLTDRKDLKEFYTSQKNEEMLEAIKSL